MQSGKDDSEGAPCGEHTGNFWGGIGRIGEHPRAGGALGHGRSRSLDKRCSIVTSVAIHLRPSGGTPASGDRRRRLLGAAASLCLIPAVASLTGCAVTAPASGLQPPYAPLMFECRHPTRATMHLFGTLHVGLPEFYPLPEAIQLALDEAPRLAVEIDARRHWQALVAAFRPHVRLAEGLTLTDLVDPSLLLQIREHFGFSDGVWRELKTMQPWWIANFRFDTDRDRRSGVSPALGSERHLIDAALRRGKALIELETIEEQVTGLATGTMAEQLLQLHGWFETVRRRGGLLGDLLAAWRIGDIEGLSALKDELWGTTDRLQTLRSRFFTERDRRMANRLFHFAAAGAPLFVAVGAYHLAGQDSLPARLTDLGYRVDRVDTRGSIGTRVHGHNGTPNRVGLMSLPRDTG